MGSIVWMALTIPAVTYGGVGKHLWDITYKEFFWYFKVGRARECIVLMVLKLLTRIVSLSLLESNRLSSTLPLA